MSEVIDIPEGYQKTRLGLIPTDWKIKPLSAVCPLQRGFDLPTTEVIEGTYPVVYSNGVLRKHDKWKVKGPGIVTGRSGTIGKVTYVNADFWPHNTSLWVTTFCGNDEKFVFFLLNFVRLERFKSGSGVPTLNRNDVHTFKVGIPPLPEQQKIAQILSTWDLAISTTNNLIKEIKLRNKGLAQQLLTGKKRLKGFNGEWRELTLIDIADRVKRKNDELDDTVVTISAQRGFVLQEDFFTKRVASETLSSYYLLHKGEFAYNKSYSNGYPMGAFKRLDDFEKAVVTTLYICFSLKKNVNSDFINHFFEAGLMIRPLMKIAQEGGRAHGLLNIGIHDFFGLKTDYSSPWRTRSNKLCAFRSR